MAPAPKSDSPSKETVQHCVAKTAEEKKNRVEWGVPSPFLGWCQNPTLLSSLHSQFSLCEEEEDALPRETAEEEAFQSRTTHNSGVKEVGGPLNSCLFEDLLHLLFLQLGRGENKMPYSFLLLLQNVQLQILVS